MNNNHYTNPKFELKDCGKIWDALSDVQKRKIGKAAIAYAISAEASYSGHARQHLLRVQSATYSTILSGNPRRLGRGGIAPPLRGDTSQPVNNTVSL